MAKNNVDKEKPLMLPAAPFLEWVRDLIAKNDGSLEYVARLLGVAPRRVQAFRDGYYWGGRSPSRKTYFEFISIDVIDRCLIHEGRTFLFQLYPALYTFNDDEPTEMAA